MKTPFIKGDTARSEYWVWRGIRACIHNGRCKAYPNYGGRGIGICEERDRDTDGYWNFLNDMGDRPSGKHGVDRIDNDGDYEPENCRWALPAEQGENKRKRNGNKEAGQKQEKGQAAHQE